MTVVAVSRQVGSYGDEIASLVAERLGFQVIGQTQVHELAESCDPEFKDACALYEREVTKGFWERFFLNDPAYASLFESLNYQVAAKGDAVILGRGAQIVLGGIPGVLRVRVVAPIKVRAERLMKVQGGSFDDAFDFAQKHTHQRRTLIQQLYHKDLSDWSLYDLILNTENMEPEGAAGIVQAAVKNMAAVENPDAVRAELKRRALAKLVESAVRKKVSDAAYRVVEATCPEEGHVVLTGDVTELKSKEAAQAAAEKFAGVTKVENKIRVVEFKYF